jgi:hypothetical protein
MLLLRTTNVLALQLHLLVPIPVPAVLRGIWVPNTGIQTLPLVVVVEGIACPGELAPSQRKGDHTTFGNGLGHDPSAGSGFVDIVGRVHTDLDRLVVVQAVRLVGAPVYRAPGISGLRGIISARDTPRGSRCCIARLGMGTPAERLRRG